MKSETAVCPRAGQFRNQKPLKAKRAGDERYAVCEAKRTVN
jgi:hypothetical protein